MANLSARAVVGKWAFLRVLGPAEPWFQRSEVDHPSGDRLEVLMPRAGPGFGYPHVPMSPVYSRTCFIYTDRLAFVIHLGGPLSAGLWPVFGRTVPPAPCGFASIGGAPFGDGSPRFPDMLRPSLAERYQDDPSDLVALRWCSGAGSGSPRQRCQE